MDFTFGHQIKKISGQCVAKKILLGIFIAGNGFIMSLDAIAEAYHFPSFSFPFGKEKLEYGSGYRVEPSTDDR